SISCLTREHDVAESFLSSLRLPRLARRLSVPDPVISLAIIWLGGLIVLSVLAPWLSIADPSEQDLLHMLAPPGSAHWLGADTLGRDLLSRVIYGARVSLGVGLGSVTIGLLAGGFLGLIAGYYQ